MEQMEPGVLQNQRLSLQHFLLPHGAGKGGR